jgi:cytoskeletal protein RodZ
LGTNLPMAKGNFGERLKREREMREVTLNEVTLGTRIGTRFLEAFENEDWHKLPGGAFNRGFVRSIARYLGLDEENLLAEYDLAYGQQIPAHPTHEERIPSTPKWVVAALAVGLLLVIAGIIAGGIYGWRRFAAHRAAKSSASAAQNQSRLAPGSGGAGRRQDSAPANSSAANSSAGNSSSGNAGPPPNAGYANAGLANSGSANSSPSAASVRDTPAPVAARLPLDLSLSASAATRVRVVADGMVLLDSEVSAGDTHHFSAARQFEVTVADSSVVLLELNGKAMPPIGGPGASGTIVLSQKDLR